MLFPVKRALPKGNSHSKSIQAKAFVLGKQDMEAKLWTLDQLSKGGGLGAIDREASTDRVKSL